MNYRLLLLVLLPLSVRAEIYELPPEGVDVVGSVATVEVGYDDTLIDIARRHGLGYHDIVRANPDVNVWLPGEGTRVVLPTQFVLPSGPRKGLVLNLAEYRMYYYPEPKPGETAYVMTYPMSIGRMDWETPLGMTSVVAKAVDPAWYPPASVHQERIDEGREPLPRVVPPGPDNPLGTRAMRLGLPGYLIHGTNRPAGVGMRVTHGCIRMFPEDIEFLFGHVALKTPVRIVNEPVKIGWDGEALVMEAHPVLENEPDVTRDEPGGEAHVETTVADTEQSDDAQTSPKSALTYVTERFVDATRSRQALLDWARVETLVVAANGVPMAVGSSTGDAQTSLPASSPLPVSTEEHADL
ncbi:MAG: L,D-transpeptidase family protein [Pseudomonadota bacterium]